VNPKNFFGELKRRHVYKVAVAYAVVAWLLIQVATQVFPFFEIPNWGIRLVILLLVLGFPVALMLAWAFDLTPEGIKRTEDVDLSKPVAGKTGRKLDFLIIAALLLIIGILVFQRLNSNVSPAVSSLPEKSIAVLPLENLSDEKENAFFADGIQDELLTSLSKIKDLKVISRTSVMQYKSGIRRNLREIAQQLDVANILEGSVRRADNHVRVSVQLIDARSDRHVWAENYDRTLADSISLQGELAGEIATALRATLSREEKARVETKPTNNADAYVLYLQARGPQNRPSALLQDKQLAEQLYKQAIVLDPKFALAHARLSQTIAEIYHEFQPTKAREIETRAEAEEALRLQPNLGEGHLARALSFFWIDADFEQALKEFDLASRLMPNNADTPRLVAALRRRQGRWPEALAKFREAAAIDPQNGYLAHETANTYGFLHNWSACARSWDRAKIISPDLLYPKIYRGYVDFWWKGDTGPLKNALATIPAGVDPDGLVTLTRWDIGLIERDFAAAERAVAACRIETIPAASGPPLPKSYLRGCIALARGDKSSAQSFFETARPSLEAEVLASPQDSFRHAYLGLLYAYMGRKEDAVREGRRACELKPESKDAVTGAWMGGFLALIYARLGEADLALPLIEHYLTHPGGFDNFEESITPGDLKLRWEWDPIRKDPRFQKLLAGPEQKPLYQ
jgi:TolB-like protein/Tfp pilus assembly protein PilF